MIIETKHNVDLVISTGNNKKYHQPNDQLVPFLRVYQYNDLVGEIYDQLKRIFVHPLHPEAELVKFAFFPMKATLQIR